MSEVEARSVDDRKRSRDFSVVGPWLVTGRSQTLDFHKLGSLGETTCDPADNMRFVRKHHFSSET
jgi:hypothetical protein